MAGRVTQIVVEVDALGNPTGRVTQVVEEIGAWGQPSGRSSQVVLEMGAWNASVAHSRASQVVEEVAAWNDPVAHTRCSQVVLEVLVFNHKVSMPLVYPELIGLNYKVVWRIKAVNAPVQTHVSGREVRLSYSNYPLHEFDLSYDILFARANLGELDQKKMMGFFMALGGSLSGFCFRNPDDYQVKNQAFATTDGVSSQFGPLVRTYGASGYSSSEPVGFVDLTCPFRLYRDGYLIDPGDQTWGYTVQTTVPVSQMVKFNNTPASGHVLTVDMNYFYWCRFKDDSMDFEKFMLGLWDIQKLTLVSLRG